ncbi:MAG: ParD-like family protein [Gammaproteobacteria bacterium]|nr:ParD-like family protein [Gammaproteobacteria bacterium]
MRNYKCSTLKQWLHNITMVVEMGIPIRINESIYNDAKKVASAEFRSIPNQIEYWAKLGKCALDNPDLPVEFIRDVLLSKLQDKSLAEPFYFEGKSE